MFFIFHLCPIHKQTYNYVNKFLYEKEFIERGIKTTPANQKLVE